ncbi:hypothetical protein NE237_030420 [Protea cynaroides]|uniref:Uncharacterized protein n=1 Tax=Protea cynaroides TaxID=273540 RepID=A0A9Q0GVW3_9MAGN|nr:hypothetical protein NE237_030420 [Protea cynaroides]
MGWSEAEMSCRKHPGHRRTPGVCSYCLRERLIKLSVTNYNGKVTEEEGLSCSSSLSSSPYSSGATSSDSSPLHEGRVSGSLFLKSRSVMASGTKTRSRTRVAVEAMDEKKKLGFWSKLLRSTGKKTKKMLTHSGTVR